MLLLPYITHCHKVLSFPHVITMWPYVKHIKDIAGELNTTFDRSGGSTIDSFNLCTFRPSHWELEVQYPLTVFASVSCSNITSTTMLLQHRLSVLYWACQKILCLRPLYEKVFLFIMLLLKHIISLHKLEYTFMLFDTYMSSNTKEENKTCTAINYFPVVIQNHMISGFNDHPSSGIWQLFVCLWCI